MAGHRLGSVVGGFLAFSLGLPAAYAGPGDPMQVRMSFCEPEQSGSEAPMYGGPGFGNTAAERTMNVSLAYHTVDAADDVAAAIALIDKIELCTFTFSSPTLPATEMDVPVMTCPGTAPWVLFDRAAGIGAIDPAHVAAGSNPAKPIVPIVPLPLDWHDAAQAGVVIAPRVNGTVDLASFLAQGWCANWTLLADDPSDGRFEIFGISDTQPLSCTGPTVATDGSPLPVGGTNSCITADQAEYMRLVHASIEDANLSRVQASLPPASRVISWTNGMQGGVNQPVHVFIGPHPYAWGQSLPGWIRLNEPAYRNIIPTNPPDTALPFGAPGDVLRLTPHEYQHKVQSNYARERPNSKPHVWDFPGYSEAMASSAEITLCLDNYPNAPAAESCVSGGRYGVNGMGFYGIQILQQPDRTVINRPYTSSLFWQYLYEQFAYPVGSGPHPGTDVASALERAANADTLALVDRPESDEGIDLLGLLYDGFGNTGSGISTYDATSAILTNVLGRSLEDALLDFHTALYLKDYSTDPAVTDPRWRFQWADRDGFRTATLLETQKPFTVPNDLYGATCNSTGSRCDGLLRAFRAADSWQLTCNPANPPCLTAPDRNELGTAELRASDHPVDLEPWSTNVASVHLLQPDWTGRTLKVHAESVGGGPLRFRIFRIDSQAMGPGLVPTPMCGSAPLWECPLTPAATGSNQVVDIAVPVEATTQEVLLLASAGDGNGKFEWSFGDANTSLAILSPTTTKPAFIGHPTSLRRSFLAEIRARDGDNEPVILRKSDVTVSINGCAAMGGCTLGQDQFSFLPLSGGNHFIVATVPAELYPAGNANLELEVSAPGFPTATETGALIASTSPRSQATVFVLDKSGSMADFEKMPALKIVARGLLQSLMPAVDGDMPTNQLGIVSFNEDADTTLPLTEVSSATKVSIEAAINGLVPAGATSVGDGVLEGQSLLAAFDGAAAAPDSLAMIVMSDGLTNTDAHPSMYYDEQTPPTNDGRGTAWTGTLNWFQRKNNGLRLPEIGTIGIGQDAALIELDRLARLAGNETMALPGPEGTQPLRDATTDFADVWAEAFNRMADYDRTAAAITTGDFVDEGPVISVAGSPAVALAQVVSGPVTIPVEAGAAELRVSVTTAFAGHAAGTLKDQNGTVYAATSFSTNGDSAAYRIFDPPPGNWTFTSHAATVSGPAVFVEGSVRGPVQLFTTVDAPDVGAPPDVAPPERTDVLVRAVPFELGPMLGCTGKAGVRQPSFALRFYDLFDDGKHGDGDASDGVYGALVPRTPDPGVYDVVIDITCTSALSGSTVVRQAHGSFIQRDVPDDDGDMMADSWEDDHGLDRTVNDGSGDPDGDGLSNFVEFRIGTDPQLPDTDFGGESDGSEFDAGRDPRDPADDVGSTPHPIVFPGDGMVCIRLDMLADGLTPVVERAPNAVGPYAPLRTLSPGTTFWCDTTAPNDAESCYRVHLEGASLPGGGRQRSGLSTPVCSTPRVDPYPPRLEPVVAPPKSCSRNVELEFRVLDTRPGLEGNVVPENLGVVDSPVEEMRYWFGVGEAPAGLAWQPLDTTLDLRLPDLAVSTVSIEVRDGAGNVSEPLVVIVHGCRDTAIGRAIALEERAVDLIEAGDIRGAREAIADSLPEIRRALQHVFHHAHHHHRRLGAVHAGRLLYRILTLKLEAKHLLHSHRCTRHSREFRGALAALEKALELEKELVELAERHHLELK